MNYTTVYVGMDVHKESFSLCCYTNEKELPEYPQRVDAHYSKVINYIEAMRFHYGDDAVFVCGYEDGYRYEGRSHWTQAHLKWLHSLKPDGLFEEILREYILTFEMLTDKIERLDRRIEELASNDTYRENVQKLCCFIGVKTVTALSVLTEIGDFKRFSNAQHFASYIGLTPGEDSSGGTQKRLGITKAGNQHVRTLLVEAAQCFSRGQTGHKSKALKARQYGNTPEVIAYADKANERLRRRYYRMVLANNKKTNVAKTAVARELACFMWGMMTNNIV